MKLVLHHYDIFPKVFLINRETKITIKPLGIHVAFEGEYTIKLMSMAHGNPTIYPERNNRYPYLVQTGEDGCLVFSHTFPEEGEYAIFICKQDKTVARLSVYALAEDMKGRYPYLGDLHMHTCRSDGKQDPRVVVSNYRKNGYDFMVVSDHERYYPSLDAIDAFKEVPHELNIVFGEEVHLPGNDIHIVNFGGTYSVNGLLEGRPQNRESDRRAVVDNPPPVISEEEYRAQVNQLIEELDIPDGIEKFTYASCVWIFRHIRNAGGLGIYAHPYWITDAYQVPESFGEYMTKTHPFDAFEVLGGESYFQHNGFQTSRYYEDRANGIDYPIVGSTDSHSSIKEENSIALLSATFVFAKENERAALILAIKDKYSVAIDRISPEYRLVGDFRLVKYARFLLDEFTPLHDELCYEDGRLMKAYAFGDEDAKKTLECIYGRTKKLFKKYFEVEE